MKTQIKISVIFALAFIMFSCKKNNENPVNNNTVTDIDGNVYHTVTIGSQVWMLENLKTTRFNDGSTMITGLSDAEWKIGTSSAYCVYDNYDANNTMFGKLYNWYAVSNGKLAPKGWHIPSDAEWGTLIDFLGGAAVAGNRMKDSTLWYPSNGIINNNTSGFTALPGGVRRYLDGVYILLSNLGNFWSSTEYTTNVAWSVSLNFNTSSADRIANDKKNGFSVRCIKD